MSPRTSSAASAEPISSTVTESSAPKRRGRPAKQTAETTAAPTASKAAPASRAVAVVAKPEPVVAQVTPTPQAPATTNTKPAPSPAADTSTPAPAALEPAPAQPSRPFVAASSFRVPPQGMNRRPFRQPFNNRRQHPQQHNYAAPVDHRGQADSSQPTELVKGFLDIGRDGNGIIRKGYSDSEQDAYIAGAQIRRYRLRPGDEIVGPARKPKDSEQYWGLVKIDSVNGMEPEKASERVKFNNLTPVYPDKKIVLETDKDTLSTRMIDLIAPVGRGQRGMIVSPPKAGKTTIIKEISTGIAANFGDLHLMAVLIGERPEEVTDIRRHIAKITGDKGEVAASNFDELPTEQVRVAELALERAKRLVERGAHVVILLDSITRLARAYNLAMPTSGRTLSGGFDPAALTPPKRFFGAARNFEEFETPEGMKNGSLTILGTALVDTGSRMDDLIYEEFKGTGNMELHLDRQLAERRIYPAIDVQRSGTRREDLLFNQMDYQSVVMMRRMIDMLEGKDRTAALVERMKHTKTNKEFLAALKD